MFFQDFPWQISIYRIFQELATLIYTEQDNRVKIWKYFQNSMYNFKEKWEISQPDMLFLATTSCCLQFQWHQKYLSGIILILQVQLLMAPETCSKIQVWEIVFFFFSDNIAKLCSYMRWKLQGTLKWNLKFHFQAYFPVLDIFHASCL